MEEEGVSKVFALRPDELIGFDEAMRRKEAQSRG